MRYYYYVSGQKMGPISSDEIREKAASGEIVRQTLIETEAGRQYKAKKITGLVFPETRGAEPPVPPHLPEQKKAPEPAAPPETPPAETVPAAGAPVESVPEKAAAPVETIPNIPRRRAEYPNIRKVLAWRKPGFWAAAVTMAAAWLVVSTWLIYRAAAIPGLLAKMLAAAAVLIGAAMLAAFLKCAAVLLAAAAELVGVLLRLEINTRARR